MKKLLQQGRDKILNLRAMVLGEGEDDSVVLFRMPSEALFSKQNSNLQAEKAWIGSLCLCSSIRQEMSSGAEGPHWNGICLVQAM